MSTISPPPKPPIHLDYRRPRPPRAPRPVVFSIALTYALLATIAPVGAIVVVLKAGGSWPPVAALLAIPAGLGAALCAGTVGLLTRSERLLALLFSTALADAVVSIVLAVPALLVLMVIAIGFLNRPSGETARAALAGLGVVFYFAARAAVGYFFLATRAADEREED